MNCEDMRKGYADPGCALLALQQCGKATNSVVAKIRIDLLPSFSKFVQFEHGGAKGGSNEALGDEDLHAGHDERSFEG